MMSPTVTLRRLPIVLFLLSYCSALPCESTTQVPGQQGVDCPEACTCATNAVCNNVTGECSGMLCGHERDLFTCDKNSLSLVVIATPLVAIEMTSFVLTCIVNLIPDDVSVHWRNPRGDRVLKGTKYNITTESDTVYDLIINSAESEDSGAYTCVAVLKEPTCTTTSVTKSVKITIFAPGRIFLYPDMIIKKTPGQSLELTCQAFFGLLTMSSLEWLRDNQTVEDSALMTQYFIDTEVILTRSIEMANLSFNHNGTYQCQAMEGKNITDVRDVHVFIVDHPIIQNLVLADASADSLSFFWELVSSGNDNVTCTLCVDGMASYICNGSRSCSVAGLYPYTSYNISVGCENFAGASDTLTYENAWTLASDPPDSITIEESASYCNITWAPSERANGPDLYYKVQQRIAQRDVGKPMDDWTSERLYQPALVLMKDSLALNSVYSYGVASGNDFHQGSFKFSSETCTTPRGVPDVVPDLVLYDSKDAVTSTSVEISVPRLNDRNGPISCYEFVVVRNLSLLKSHPDDDIQPISEGSAPDDGMFYAAVVLSSILNVSSVIIGEEAAMSSECRLRKSNVSSKRSVLQGTTSVLSAVNIPLEGGTDYAIFLRVYTELDNGSVAYLSSDYFTVTTATTGLVPVIIIIIILLVVILMGVLCCIIVCVIRRSHSHKKETITHDGDRDQAYMNDGYTPSSYLSLPNYYTAEGESTGYHPLSPTRQESETLKDVSAPGDNLGYLTMRPISQDTEITDDGYDDASSTVLNRQSGLTVRATAEGVLDGNVDSNSNVLSSDRMLNEANSMSGENNDDSGSIDTSSSEGYENGSECYKSNISGVSKSGKRSSQISNDSSSSAYDEPPHQSNLPCADSDLDVSTEGKMGSPDVSASLNDPGARMDSVNGTDGVTRLVGADTSMEPIHDRLPFESEERSAQHEYSDGRTSSTLSSSMTMSSVGTLVHHGYYDGQVYEEIPHTAEDSGDDYARGLYDKWWAPEPIKVSQLPEYVEHGKKRGPHSFEREFAVLPQGQQESWTVAARPENEHKNPFPNVLPYDHSRVKLSKIPDDPFSDYYNASFITDQFNKTSFIAAQGPSVGTVEDFWRMVWQEQVEVIVMVTKLQQGEGKVLCHQYWPDAVNKTARFGSISIEVKSVINFPDYNIRSIEAKREDKSLTIMQFEFLSWPYMKVPSKSTSLLSFVRRVKQARASSTQSPLLVHCSDGVGATGTFLALYCTLDDLTDPENEICVCDYIKQMRKNRIDMVQTGAQYTFIYDVLLEAYSTPEAEISLDKLMTLEVNSDVLEKEFQYLKKPRIELETQVGGRDENKHKNRVADMIPLDEFRPVLLSESLMGGNDYINACFADSYFKAKKFILTQWPKPQTVEDFWRLVYDHQCSKIVMLHSIDGSDKTIPFYWPRGGTVQYGSMTVESIEDNEESCYMHRKFKVTHMGCEDSLSVEQYEVRPWPESAEDLPAFTAMVEALRDHDDAPTLIHHISGYDRSGVLVAVLHELERISQEGTINVFEAAQMLRTTNSFAVTKLDEYVEIYSLLKGLTTMDDVN